MHVGRLNDSKLYSSGPKGFLGGYCADLSTSMKFGTDVDQNILNSFFESTKAGAHGFQI